jgi:hypothetical protein
MIGSALTLSDPSSMRRPAEWYEGFDPITADFTYIPWLGDRKGIEQQTRTWNKIIVDRRPELSEWAKVRYRTVRRGVSVFAGPEPVRLGRARDHRTVPRVVAPRRSPGTKGGSRGVRDRRPVPVVTPVPSRPADIEQEIPECFGMAIASTALLMSIP